MTAISIASPAPRLRLTERGRNVLVGLIAVPLSIGALWFAMNGGGATATLNGATEYTTVTVQAGDTLWQIAETIAPSADPRDVIVDLMQFNGLSSADVPAGFELAVPPSYGP